MLAQLHRQAQFGAHPVRAGHQHRFLVPFGQFEKRAETPESRQYLRATRALGDGFNPVDEALARVYVHTCVFVAEGGFLGIAHRKAYLTLEGAGDRREKVGILPALRRPA